MTQYRPLSPTFSQENFGELVMRDLGGSFVARGEETNLQYCRVIGGGIEGPRIYRCSPTLAEAKAEPQQSVTEYSSLPDGAIQL